MRKKKRRGELDDLECSGRGGVEFFNEKETSALCFINAEGGGVWPGKKLEAVNIRTKLTRKNKIFWGMKGNTDRK